MKLKTLMSIKSAICLLFGVSFVLLPVQLMALFGIPLDANGAFVARMFGVSFILLGLWLGLDRNTQEIESKRAVAISVAVGDLLGCAVMVYGLLTGIGNVWGWVFAALYLLLGVGFGYTLLVEPEGKLAI